MKDFSEIFPTKYFSLLFLKHKLELKYITIEIRFTVNYIQIICKNSFNCNKNNNKRIKSLQSLVYSKIS